MSQEIKRPFVDVRLRITWLQDLA